MCFQFVVIGGQMLERSDGLWRDSDGTDNLKSMKLFDWQMLLLKWNVER